MAKKFPIKPANPERICWGCDRYCPADSLQCGNGAIATPHPCELFGDDWMEWALAAKTVETADVPAEEPTAPGPARPDQQPDVDAHIHGGAEQLQQVRRATDEPANRLPIKSFACYGSPRQEATTDGGACARTPEARKFRHRAPDGVGSVVRRVHLRHVLDRHRRLTH